MKRKGLLMLIGSVCLALMLAVPLVASCAPATPEEAAGEVAALESKLAAEKAKVSGLQGDVSDLEAEIAELRTPAEVFELKFSSWGFRGCVHGDDVFPAFCENIDRMSDGQLIVPYYASGEVAAVEEEFEAVRTGLIQIASLCPSFYKGIAPAADIETGVCGGLTDVSELEQLFWERGWVDIFRDEVYPPLGLYYVGPMLMPSGYKLLSTVPITSLEDIRGLKVRAHGASATILEELGAEVVFIPWGECYMALATGTIDAGSLGFEMDFRDLKGHEFAPYIMEPALVDYFSGNYVVNMDVWSTLPEHLQQIIHIAAKENSQYSSIVTLEGNLEAWVEIRAEGAEHTYLSGADLEEFRAVTYEIRDEYATKGPICARLIEILKDLMRDYGYIE